MMKKWILTALGAILVAIAAVGLVLPVLPTTPFVLLAAGCFSAGNPALAAWLERSPLFGEYIRDRKSGCGVTKQTKIRSLIFLWGMLALSVGLTQKLWLTVLLAVVGAAVTVHILLLKTACGGKK